MNINVMFPCIFFWPFFWLYWIGAVKTDRKDDGRPEDNNYIYNYIYKVKMISYTNSHFQDDAQIPCKAV